MPSLTLPPLARLLACSFACSALLPPLLPARLPGRSLGARPSSLTARPGPSPTRPPGPLWGLLLPPGSFRLPGPQPRRPDARRRAGGPTERRRHRRGACVGTQMAAPVPWACCAVLAAAAAVVYAQRHSPQEAPHVQYERLGSDVTLPCGTANWDAAVTWRVNGTDLAPDLLNGSQLVLRGLELGHSGLYACFHRDSWHLRHQVLLHVGLPPREPVLSCRSNTYPKGFYCSWHLPTPTYIPNTFNVTVLHGSKIMVCEKDPALKNRCHIRYMHLFSTIKYKVSISVSNALGHNATAITFDEFTIVKPDPPENVVARPVPSNPRRLEVTWQTPSTWPDPESFPLKFFLRYRPLILDQWQHVELSDGTAHTITDAYAGKEYIIQVAAKDNEIGTWSDWSVAAHATPWTEEPRHLTTEAQAAETTTSTTSSLAPPPTTKICDPGELGSGGGPSAPFLVSVPITLALAAAAATASSLLIW
ncbi:ciliary neurotrophic factor receptor subunit alpha isoform X3 [Pan troglodytes]|uniref:ciliary neurotrophic factor receptor subunit alpha isoform X3 n=1 Tax=Pan troglodytes TaxID=9598 RepID=UPI0023F31B58|nr:ciliary neurotrophic factor receptor subunit alpha isoform X2 [Pan troglodytes]